MKRYIVVIGLMLVAVTAVNHAGFNFGLTRGIKKKVEKIDKKVEEKKEAQRRKEEEEDYTFTEFTHLPFDLEYVAAITPIGNILGTHTRSNPQTVRPFGFERHAIWHKNPGTAYNVYAPATTYIYSVRKSQGIGDYGMNFRITDRISFRHDHIHSIADTIRDKVEAQIGPWEESSPFIMLPEPIPVKAGDLLGQTGFKAGSVNWDWFVGEGGEPNPGITNPDSYVTSMGQLFIPAKSVYDYASDELKSTLADLTGYWNGVVFEERVGNPPMGQCGDDIAGTLSGIWFYDTADDPTWGPKVALFLPYYLDTENKISIRLAVPELSVYGAWTVTLAASGSVDIAPKDVTVAKGAVYYVLDDNNSEENGLLRVEMNPDGSITIETSTDTAVGNFPDFTGAEKILTR